MFNNKIFRKIAEKKTDKNINLEDKVLDYSEV